MQRRTRDARFVLRAVEKIPHQRMTDVRHVYADLVRAPRFQQKFNEGNPSIVLDLSLIHISEPTRRS